MGFSFIHGFSCNWDHPYAVFFCSGITITSNGFIVRNENHISSPVLSNGFLHSPALNRPRLPKVFLSPFLWHKIVSMKSNHFIVRLWWGEKKGGKMRDSDEGGIQYKINMTKDFCCWLLNWFAPHYRITQNLINLPRAKRQWIHEYLCGRTLSNPKPS